jgi:SAM-dependent methyltransferase
MITDRRAIEADVAAYFADTLDRHGPTPAGVDWRDGASQRARFDQLGKLFTADPAAGVADLGCGYGAFARYLRSTGHAGRYLGIDLSPAMIEAARGHTADLPELRFEVGNRLVGPVDYAIASGIFNVRLGHDADRWQGYIEATIDEMATASTRGFGFNCLTSYSDPDRMRPDLHYTDPLALFDRCKRRYSRHVALLHDYGLYEFTILVRKDVDIPR